MIKIKSQTKRRDKGFSLAEVLIVVAIIGILLAVAIPNVIAYYRSLKLTELDDSARSIFMAAQNRLTALKNEGRDLSRIGSDANAKASDGNDVKVNYVIKTATGSDADFRTILPGGSIEGRLQDYNMVVEFMPGTGAVFAVWYWEKGDFDYTDAYVTVTTEKDSRIKKMAGYYGGSEIDWPGIGQMPFPEVTIINAEELRVNIKMQNTELDGYYGYDANNVKISVRVDGVEIVPNTTLWPDNTATIVLDTLWDNDKYTMPASTSGTDWIYGKRYKEWGLPKEPGENITVTVVASYEGTVTKDGETHSLLPQSVSATVNSLFEKVEGDTAYISYGRHLQNLDTDTSDVTSGITAAVQTRDINFAWNVEKSTAVNPSNSKDPVYYWGDTYGKGTIGSYEDFNVFHPITNYSLTEFDGGGFEIRNIRIESDSYAGLFSFTMSMDFNDVTLVNANVHSRAIGSSVGGLVGFAGEVTIDKCNVYVDFDNDKDWLALGEGLDRCVLDDLKITEDGTGGRHMDALDGLPYIGAPEQDGTAGGFAGIANVKAKISNSFCAVAVIGENGVGGFVGNVGGYGSGAVDIKKSYSASFLYGNYYIGGLVGHVTSGLEVDIKNCYAAGEIKLDKTGCPVAAGFFTREDTADPADYDVRNCYSAVKFVGTTGEISADHGGQVYGTYPGDDPADSHYNYYIADPDVTAGYGLKATGDPDVCGNKVTAAELMKAFEGDTANWSVEAGADGTFTHPYHLLTKLANLDVYPYPMLKDADGNPVPHYGDWLEDGG